MACARKILVCWFGLACLLLPMQNLRADALLNVQELSAINGKWQLRGPWEFYWEKFLEPQTPLPSPDAYLQAGMSWKNGDNHRSSLGFASYRIRLKGFEAREEGYELGLSFILSAYRLMIFPEQHPERMRELKVGVVGKSKGETIPKTSAQSLAFHPEGSDEVWVILLQIANFDHPNGGLRCVPAVAPGPILSQEYRHQTESAYFCIGILIIMFLYNLMIYVRRNEDKASLFGALAILSMALRTVATENLLYHWVGRPGRDILHLNHNLEYLTITGTGILFSLFMQHTFPSAGYPVLLRRMILVSLPLVLAAVFLPPFIFTQYLPLYQLSMVVFVGYGAWVIVRALKQKHDGSRTVFIGLILILVSIIYDLFVNYGLLPDPPILQYATALYIFMGSETLAKRFAQAFRTAEKLQGNLQREVYQQTAEIQLILSSIPQGIFTMGSNLRIEGRYSQHLEHILQCRSLEGMEALPLLFGSSDLDSESQSMQRSALLAAMDEDMVAWELNQHCLIREFQTTRSPQETHIFELDWNPMCNAEGKIVQVLVTLRDVTDWRKLQEVNKKREEEMNLVLELVPISDSRWQDFMRQSKELLDRAEALLLGTSAGSDLRPAAVALHTLKGLARSLGFRYLSTAVHTTEDLLRSGTLDAVPVRDALMYLRLLLRRYESLWLEKLNRSVGKIEGLRHQDVLLEELVYQRQHQAQNPGNPALNQKLLEVLDHYVQRTLFVSLIDLLRETSESLGSLAVDLGKEPPMICLEGEDRWIHRKAADALRMSLVHLVRNCLDHGLESPAERRAQGKNPRGSLTWNISQQPNCMRISCRDDGRGLDIESFQKKAVQLGIVPSIDITELMFISGLSTKEVATEVSGRGVGMDALRSNLIEIGGRVFAKLLDSGETGSRFRLFETIIELPLTQISSLSLPGAIPAPA